VSKVKKKFRTSFVFTIFATNMVKRVFILVSVIFMCSCVTTRKVNYLQEPDKFIPSYEQAPPPEDYILQVGDRINVYVYSLDQEVNGFFNRSSSSGGGEFVGESSSYTIYSDSCVHYPVLGDIKVVGKTVRDVSNDFKMLLRGNVVKEDLTVRVTLVNDYCYVLGESGSRQVAIPNRQTNIFQVLSSELDDYSDKAHIKILRQLGNGATEMKEFDLRSKDILTSEYYYVRPNDVIYIGKFKGQFFNIGTFSTMLSVILSVITFGTFIYGITTRY